MELEELKNHGMPWMSTLKDKELIKEEELGKLDRTCRQRYPCHCPAEYQTHPDFFAGIGLIPAGSPVARQTESDLYHYHSIVDSLHSTGTSPPPVFYNRRKWTKCL